MYLVTRSLTGADIIEELAEEIRKQYGGRGGLKAFAADMGVNYHSFRRYMSGESKMSADLLMESLIYLRVDPAEFFMQLRARIESELEARAEER